MTFFQYALPFGLLILVFIFTLLIDRKVTLTDFIIALLNFPTNATFLGLSLVMAFVISSNKIVDIGLFIFIAYIILCMIIVFLDRRATNYFERDRIVLASVLGFLSYLVSIPSLFYSARLIVVGI
ncbi:hypothetical protein ES703_71250 [subsurface metagenome]